MKKFFLAIAIMFTSVSYASDVKLPYKEVIDGDTIRTNIPIVCPLCNVYVRIRGIDTPESNYLAKCPEEKQKGIAAKHYLQSLLEGESFFIAKNVSWDKYGGRILADVEVDGKNLAEDLIESGLAKPYSGKGPKPNWCN